MRSTKNNFTCSHLRCCANVNILCKAKHFKKWRHVYLHQLSNNNMQDGIQDGSQNIKTVFHVFLRL